MRSDRFVAIQAAYGLGQRRIVIPHIAYSGDTGRKIEQVVAR